MAFNFMMLSREFFEREDYFSERFSHKEAFLDLCYLAAYKPRTIKIRGNKIEVQKGQVSESEESLAQRWKWSRNTVRRYLAELEDEGIIEQQKSRIITLISIKRFLIVEQQIEQQTEQQIEQQIEQPNNIDKIDNNIFREDKSSADSGEVAPKKTRKKPVYTALGGKCREVFEEFYKGKVGEDYQYSAADGSNMKYLLNKIKSARESRNMPIDDENMISAFRAFLGSINDEWVLRNLSVKVINSKYNEIVSSAKAGKKFDIFDINHSYDGYDPHRYDNSMELWNKTK